MTFPILSFKVLASATFLKMTTIRKSPFRVDEVEDDPHAFGNRPEEVKTSLDAIYNNQNILISGPRGIGKSSLGCQLHKLYKGDYTLTKRCDIDVDFQKYLTCVYKCEQNTTLASFALDLINRLENQCILIKSFNLGKKKKFQTSINLGIVKTSLTTEVETNKPASIATRLVNGFNTIYGPLIEFTKYNGISIIVDDLEQLNQDINFGNFVKLIHEYLCHDEIKNVNFIFAGLKGIYTRLIEENPSMERIVNHVPISKLSIKECKHILDYARTNKVDTPFIIESEAEDLILNMSSGYPYVIQLLGSAAFHSMQDYNRMTKDDVIKGIRNILSFDKNEKYYNILNDLTSEERKILILIATCPFSSFPASIPIDWIIVEGKELIGDEEMVIAIINLLHKQGYLTIRQEKNICEFTDELFRFFLLLLDYEKEDKIEEIYETDKIEVVSLSDPSVEKIVKQIESAEYKKYWEFDEDNF